MEFCKVFHSQVYTQRFLLREWRAQSLHTQVSYSIGRGVAFCRLQKVYSLTLFTFDTVGIANFCNMVSNLLGSGVIKWSGMSTVGDDCNFDSLPKLIIVYSIVIPTVAGIPATFLIPNILQTEKMIDWDKEQWYDVSEHNDGGQRPTEEDEENNINAGNTNREGIRHRTSSSQQVGDSRIEPHLL